MLRSRKQTFYNHSGKRQEPPLKGLAKFVLMAAVLVLAITLILQSCARHPDPVTARVVFLIKSRSQDVFVLPPLEGDTVIASYQIPYSQSYEFSSRSGASYDWCNNLNHQTEYHPLPILNLGGAARELLKKAVIEFPGINVDDLDVRSVAQIGEPQFSCARQGSGLPRAITTIPFQGVVVKAKKLNSPEGTGGSK